LRWGCFRRSQAVLEGSANDLYVLGKIEALPEGPGGDPTMQDLSALLLVGVLMARDEEGVLFLDEFDLIRGETRESHGDAVVVVADPLDVVGRPVRRSFAARLVEHVEQPVEADGER